MMKKATIKAGIAGCLLAWSVCSCLKNEIKEPLIGGPDPVTVLVGVWQETERKVGDERLQPIDDPHRLILLSSAPHANVDRNGDLSWAQEYQYNPKNLGLSVDTAGAIRFERGLLSFFHRDTVVTIKYDYDDEKTLTIWDTTVTPNVEIKYTKIN